MSTSPTFKFAPQFLAAVALLPLASTPIKAEGSKKFNGAFGVNRVVRTKSTGFVEVEGIFSVQSSMPDPKKDKVAKAHGNRPNPYLGGNIGGVEYDGGLIWQPDKTVRGNLVLRPGWSAFIWSKIGATNPEYLVNNQSRPWRYSAGQLSTLASITSKIRMTFRDDGKVALFVEAIPNGGTFFHTGQRVFARPARAATPTRPASPAVPVAPTQSDGRALFRRSKLKTADVKRVSALTRTGDPKIPEIMQILIPAKKGYHDELDGSVVTISWREGRVRKRGGALQPWAVDDVNQTATGYDGARDGAPNLKEWDMVVKDLLGRPQLSRDIAGEIASRKTVAFPKLNQGSAVGRRADTASQRATEILGIVSRYVEETVQINLRLSSAPWGKDVLGASGQ